MRIVPFSMKDPFTLLVAGSMVMTRLEYSPHVRSMILSRRNGRASPVCNILAQEDQPLYMGSISMYLEDTAEKTKEPE